MGKKSLDPFIKEDVGGNWEVSQLIEDEDEGTADYVWIATVETERLADILIEGLTKPRRRRK